MTSEVLREPQLPASSNIARRSISIFSRKGTDPPTPTTQALTLSGVDMTFGVPSSPTDSPSKLSKAKAKRWTLTGRLEARIPEGTILRAVPKDAPRPTMSSLEREMATSPNEEILRAIGVSPESEPTSPISPSSPLADITNVSPQRYYSKRAKNSQEDILGVWRDGRVQWGKENPVPEEPTSRPKSAEDARRTRSILGEQKVVKPKIQVIIPENHSARRPFSFIPLFQNSSSNRVSRSSPPTEISPPSGISGFSISSMEVSAMSPPTVYKPKPQRAFQPITVAIDESLLFNSLLVERRGHSRTTSVNSSSSDSEIDDNASMPHSSRSSMTNISVHNEEQQDRKSENHSRRGSTSSEASFSHDDDKIFVKTTIEQSTRNAATEGPRMSDMVNMIRSPSTQIRMGSGRKQRLSSSRGAKILARIEPKEAPRKQEAEMPSLDEAVKSLEASLSNFRYDSDGADAPEVVETAMSPIPEIILSPVDAPPALPRKSSKRARMSFPPQSEIVVSARPPIPTRHSAPVVNPTYMAAMEATRRAQAERRQQMQSFQRQRRESYGRLRRMSSVRSFLSLVREEDEFQHVDSNSAENVVFYILSSLETMDDLFNAALITKGFHSIFKRHELELMRETLRKECAPAWEFRESCLPVDEDEDNSAAPPPDYTPEAYFQGYKADMATVMSLKQLILQHCPTLLRAETSDAMKYGEHSRVDIALFRIWTFCQIFGSNKGREDDIVAQMDWLRGGILAHQESCTSTISTHETLYISNVLLSAPEHFARGNVGGLSAEDLYDMLEMWSCLTKLTSGIAGKTQQARQFGVFDETEVMGGDVDGEEAMLEEWQAYLLTLGLAPIQDIVASLATGDSHTAFAVAQYNGLTTWEAPFVGSSRSTFLHEAVSRLYEERICEVFSPEQIQMKEMRSIRRARDSEFRTRRSSVRSLQQPERPARLSREWGSFRSVSSPSSTSSSAFSTPTSSSRYSPPSHPSSRAAPIIPQRRQSIPLSATIRNSYFPIAGSVAEELPPYDPAAEAEAERIRQHPLQLAMQVRDADPSQHSAEKAVFRIVEMGFTSEEAKGALKITDMGDGLRVDRAVEYLMRSKGFN